jgi:hypothetical protein
MSVPIPVEVFDQSRLSAVGRTGLVGTGPDVAFDRLARAAASFCDAPLAFVTLVDDRVSWYVAAIGYPEDAERCGPVGESFCKLVIGSGERLVVGDTRRDESTLGHAVRWYLRYGLSYRDLEELLAERGLDVDHVTLYRWVQRFTPLVLEAARPCRHAIGDRWFVDETYVKVAGTWR